MVWGPSASPSELSSLALLGIPSLWSRHFPWEALLPSLSSQTSRISLPPTLARSSPDPCGFPFWSIQNPQEPGCQVRVSGGAGAEGRVLLEEVSPISRVRLCPLAPATPAALAPLPGLGVGSQGPERLSFRAERRKSSCGDWRGSLGPGWRAAGGPEVPRRRHFWGRGRPEADASSPHPGK